MHTRVIETKTLEEISRRWTIHYRTWNSDASAPRVDFTREEAETPLLLLGDHEIPLSEDTTARVCTFYGIPTAFFKRLLREEQHYILNSRMDYAVGEVSIAYNSRGLVDIRKPSQSRLESEHVLQAIHQAMSRHSEVIEAVWSPDALHLDVLQPTASDGIQCGLRFTQNRKANLAPTVRPLLFHTDSTSLLEIPDASLRIDARNQSAERIAELLGAEAQRAAARLQHDADAFRDLANTTIDGDRITRLHRVAEEHNLPVRPLADITAALSRADTPTLQHLALAIANAANASALADPHKRALRGRLQAVAGAVVTDHAARCSKCYALAV